MRLNRAFQLNKSGMFGVDAKKLPPVFWECQPNAGVQFSLAITTTDPSPLIDWGDGTVEAYTSGVAKTHPYATADGTNK